MTIFEINDKDDLVAMNYFLIEEMIIDGLTKTFIFTKIKIFFKQLKSF